MTQDEQICSLALTRIPGLGLTGALKLVSNLGTVSYTHLRAHET